MAIYPAITVGEEIAKKLKQYYFKDEPHSPLVWMKIAGMLTQLKVLSRPFFPYKDEIAMLHELAKFSKLDMDDAFSGVQKEARAITEDRPCEVSNQPRSIGGHMKDFLAPQLR